MQEGQHLLRVSLLVDWFVFMGAYGTAFVGVTLWFAHNQASSARALQSDFHSCRC